jgi:lipoyl(octanoyl) transferase
VQTEFLGRQAYLPVWRAMQAYTAARGPDSPDALWVLEHPPVYTLGQAGRREHLLYDNGIPLIPIDRGGQITYHGPGQLVVYTLIDLRRRGYGIKTLVARLEDATLAYLTDCGLAGERRAGAPGIYVDGAKIMALGLRVRGGCSYHGLALNVQPDLSAFAAINPCGYAGLAVTSLRQLGVTVRLDEAGAGLAARLRQSLAKVE